MNLILILLQADQPPTTPTHREPRDQHPDHHAHQPTLPGEIPEPVAIASMSQDESHAAAGAHDEQRRERDMAAPRAQARVAPKHREQAEDLDGEEREREDLARARQTAREHGRRHQSRVGAETGGDVLPG